MSPAIILMLSLGAVFSITALLGFFWAAKTGQFRNFEKGSRSIFDDGEPVGTPTDQVFVKRQLRKKTL